MRSLRRGLPGIAPGSRPARGERTTPDGAQAFRRAGIARGRPLLQATGPFADR